MVDLLGSLYWGSTEPTSRICSVNPLRVCFPHLRKWDGPSAPNRAEMWSLLFFLRKCPSFQKDMQKQLGDNLHSRFAHPPPVMYLLKGTRSRERAAWASHLETTSFFVSLSRVLLRRTGHHKACLMKSASRGGIKDMVNEGTSSAGKNPMN